MNAARTHLQLEIQTGVKLIPLPVFAIAVPVLHSSRAWIASSAATDILRARSQALGSGHLCLGIAPS